MKLPETLLLAVGCAAVVGCQNSFAGGRAAPAPAQTVQVEQSIPEVGAQSGRKPAKVVRPASVIAEVTQPVKKRVVQVVPEVIEPDWAEWDCPACGMG